MLTISNGRPVRLAAAWYLSDSNGLYRQGMAWVSDQWFLASTTQTQLKPNPVVFDPLSATSDLAAVYNRPARRIAGVNPIPLHLDR
jgi:hypothetical protein